MIRIKKTLACLALVASTISAQATEINVSPLITAVGLTEEAHFHTVNVLFENESKKVLYGPTFGLFYYENVLVITPGIRAEYNPNLFYAASGIAIGILKTDDDLEFGDQPFVYAMSGLKFNTSNLILKFGLGLTNPSIYSSGNVYVDGYTPSYREKLFDFGPAFEVKLGYKF